MPIYLKRTLFIGMGGTGAMALLHTKKRFLDTYGEVPAMIDFLVIDTDRNTGIKSVLERENILSDVHKNTEEKVRFSQSELIHSAVTGASAKYERNKNSLFSWMPEENEHQLRNLNIGAGQVRSNGRFAIYANHNEVIRAAKNKIDGITNITNADNGQFAPKGNGVEINFVFSIAGGTGSGSFIDVAYLIKDSLNNTDINLTGFVVLPDVFNAMQQGVSMENTESNSYGALKELDFLMRNNIQKHNLSIDFQDLNIPIKSNPFDVIFTINNKNTDGQTIDHIKDISEQIGLALFTGASELSSNVDSVYDNVKSVLAGGNLDIEGKKAWACGMGVSELFYDGNLLGNIYASRVQANMINSLLNTNGEKSQKLADNFIDDPEVEIRENNGSQNDYLIESLLNSQPDTQFPGLNDDDPDNQILAYINNIDEAASSMIESNFKNKKNQVIKKFKEYNTKKANEENGIGNVEVFLKDLEGLLTDFKGEMEEEGKSFSKDKDNIELQLQNSLQNLKELNANSIGKVFRKSEINSLKEEITELINRKASCIHELYRREYGQKFFTGFIQNILDSQSAVDTIKQRGSILTYNWFLYLSENDHHESTQRNLTPIQKPIK